MSAGGVVTHQGRVLLIATQGGRRWQLPKGHLEPGETPEQTAEREVREETGVTGRVVSRLPDVEYWFFERGAQRVHKRVYFFLMSYVGGDPSGYDPQEVSAAAWLGWEEALTRLSFANEREVVAAARKAIEPPS
ncbi:MAG TPA: NUDIX hydrolase [Thermoanaerobaculia bacterium]|nr:NUDIX hydrolase [Thermoanaerobaculia bacterium]